MQESTSGSQIRGLEALIACQQQAGKSAPAARSKVEAYPEEQGSNSHLKSDMTINKGDTIGKVGNTGVSRGAHLHFEIWAPNGTKVNPYDIYPALYNIPHR